MGGVNGGMVEEGGGAGRKEGEVGGTGRLWGCGRERWWGRWGVRGGVGKVRGRGGGGEAMGGRRHKMVGKAGGREEGRRWRGDCLGE